ncbi:pinin/SDK/memA/ protein conserved region-domain-containing protein [Lipomyces arxii]|uniref:pinin/SDK/memA/ protein conserved region-domain-containing protein n=1 Tax=Lipomyces arxii TaxID=56418 RepID=UPI0034CD7455
MAEFEEPAITESHAVSNKRDIAEVDIGNHSTENGNYEQAVKETILSATASNKRPRRDASIAAKEEKGRNRRMFGQLLTSLGKFQEETSKSKTIIRRTEIDRKVRETQLRDWQEHEQKYKEERAQRVKENEFRRLHQLLKNEARSMQTNATLLSTATSPTIYYVPFKLLDEQQHTLDDQTDAVEEEVKNKWDLFYSKYTEDFLEHMKILDGDFDGVPVSKENGSSTVVSADITMAEQSFKSTVDTSIIDEGCKKEKLEQKDEDSREAMKTEIQDGSKLTTISGSNGTTEISSQANGASEEDATKDIKEDIDESSPFTSKSTQDKLVNADTKEEVKESLRDSIKDDTEENIRKVSKETVSEHVSEAMQENFKTEETREESNVKDDVKVDDEIVIFAVKNVEEDGNEDGDKAMKEDCKAKENAEAKEEVFEAIVDAEAKSKDESGGTEENSSVSKSE